MTAPILAIVRGELPAPSVVLGPWPSTRTGPLMRPGGHRVQRAAPIMGTAVRVELWSEQRHRAESAAAAVLDELHRIDRTFNPRHASSMLARINREAAQQPMPLSAEMHELFARVLHMAALTDGAFDIVRPIHVRTAGSISQGPRDASRLMTASVSPKLSPSGVPNWRQLLLDASTRSLRFAHPHVAIHCGAWVHGHAVDRCAALLHERGIAHARICVGATRRDIGNLPEVTASAQASSREVCPWQAANQATHRDEETGSDSRPGSPASSTVIQQPWDTCTISGEAHITAVGDAQNVFQTVRKVTVHAGDGLSSAALASAVFALGGPRGLALLDNWPGVEAVVVDDHGHKHPSPGERRVPCSPSSRPGLPAVAGVHTRR